MANTKHQQSLYPLLKSQDVGVPPISSSLSLISLMLLNRDTAYLGVSILFDFIVFCTTILRTISFQGNLFPKTGLMRTIVRDGILYFAVILSGNVIWMVCALTGRESYFLSLI